MTEEFDIVISGGGLIGLTAALAFSQAGFSVAIFEKNRKPDLLNPNYDGRNTALSQSSFKMLETLGVSDDLAEHAQPIHDIIITQGSVRNGAKTDFLYFHRDFIGEEPLGYFVPNPYLRAGLLQKAERDTAKITLSFEEAIKDFHFDDTGATLFTSRERKIRAKMLLNAEGKESRLRDQAGIRVYKKPYGQKGIVTTLEHEKPHNGTAQEFFLSTGPFAALPLTGNRMSLVWTEASEIADAIMKVSEEIFLHELTRRFGNFLGEIRHIGPKFSYPLELRLCERRTEKRMFLIGDSAHSIHPMAGQGLNLGLRDVAVLSELSANARYVGLDFASELVAAEYEKARNFDIGSLAAFTGGMNALFTNDNPLLSFMRGAGLAAVNALPAVRNFFMRQAVRGGGALPKLMRGEKL